MSLAPKHFPAVLLAALVCFAQASDDKVTLAKTNEVLTGKIKKDDIDGIVIDVKDSKTNQVATRQLTVDQVTDMSWDINDAEFKAGVAAFNQASYGSAAQNFGSVISDKESFEAFRVEGRPYLLYMYGESLCRFGRVADGYKALEKFIADFPKSRYVPQALGSMIDAAIFVKDFAKTGPLLSQLRTLGNEAKGQADYLEGQVLLAQGKTKEAESKFNATSAGSAALTTKLLATVGLAQVALADGNFQRARDQAQKAVDEASKKMKEIPVELASAAYLTIGDAHAGEAAKGSLAGEQLQNKLMDAILSYMRVTLQYPGDPRTEPAAYFKTGECFQRLSKMPNRAMDRQRAMDQYGKLTMKYRDNPWARKADENMKNFK